ncbi:MAG: 50S ribosomal protein L15 [Halanaerobiales bacterium]
MDLHDLKPAPGARTKKQRVGRGMGSGRGYTSGRGANGQNSRSGGKVGPIFEGGQTPLFRRLPKHGFNNKFKKVYSEVNIFELNQFDEDQKITPELLKEEGIISKIEKSGVKILGDGEINKSLTVKANSFTSSAREKIEAAGGKAEVV